MIATAQYANIIKARKKVASSPNAVAKTKSLTHWPKGASAVS